MAFDAKNLNAYDFIADMKSKMANRLQERLESGEVFQLLEDQDFDIELNEGLSVYEKLRLKNGTKDPKTKSIHEAAFTTAKNHFLRGNSLDDAINLAKKKHGLDESYIIKPGTFPFNVDHMHGTRSVNLSPAPDRINHTDYTKWKEHTKKISAKHDDNVEHVSSSNSEQVHTLDSKDRQVKKIAHWDKKTNKGWIKESADALEENTNKDTTDIDWEKLGETEKEIVLNLKTNAKMLGSDEGAYASGVLLVTFKNKQAVEDFAASLEDYDMVDTYEIEAFSEDLVQGFDEDQEYDFDNIMFAEGFGFNVFVYIIPEIVLFPAEELDVGEDFTWDESEGNGFLTEVRRKIKVNFRGKKRVKMQCSPGFKWVPAMKTCKKISGAQVAVMRKAMRRAVLTKKSMGQSFKARVIRKSRKANRFRKSFGLK